MQRTRASILALLALVSILVLVSDVASAKPKARSGKISEVVEFELRETSGDSRTLTVPLHGDIAGWLDLLGESRLCSAKSSPTRDDLLVLEVECRSDDDRSQPMFEIHGERALVVDQPTLLGELEVSEGRRISVVATRR